MQFTDEDLNVYSVHRPSSICICVNCIITTLTPDHYNFRHKLEEQRRETDRCDYLYYDNILLSLYYPAIFSL